MDTQTWQTGKPCKESLTLSVLAVIQARMGSTRLPGKTLALINGRPMLYHVVRRVQATGIPVTVATTNLEEDTAIFNWCLEHDVPCVCGSSEDVLDRFVVAAHDTDLLPDCIVRVTADCPMMDPLFILDAVGAYAREDCEYVTNMFPPTLPDGLDVEVFSREALEWAWGVATEPWDREHVTTLIRKHRKVARVCYGVPDWATVVPATLRWTVDQPQDLELVRRVYSHLGDDFYYLDVLRLVMEHPELQTLNAGFERWRDRDDS